MKKHLFHLAIALTIAIATVAGYGFWYSIISTKSAGVAYLQNQIASQSQTINHVISARTALDKISGDETAVQNYFIPSTGVVAFIDGLESRGRAQGATVNVLSVSTGTIGTQPMFTFSFTITGTFDAVMRTIGTIEYTPYDLLISNLFLNKSDNATWNANLTLLVGSMGVATSTPNIL